MQDYKNGRGYFGHQSYTLTAAAEANPLDVQLRVAGKHYCRIYDGTPPTRGLVDSGQVTFDWNEGPYGMYASGQDFVNRYVPDETVTATQFNDTWAASSSGWAHAPSANSYRIISSRPFPHGHVRPPLYVWFLLSNTAFPWRHDTIGTAEDLGTFFGSL